MIKLAKDLIIRSSSAEFLICERQTHDKGIQVRIACDKALTEFEKYRVKQDKLYKSDFDLLLEKSVIRKGIIE